MRPSCWRKRKRCSPRPWWRGMGSPSRCPFPTDLLDSRHRAPPSPPSPPKTSVLRMRLATVLRAVVPVTALFAASAGAQTTAHPLDGLSARGHWATSDALLASGKTDSPPRYLYVALREPPKPEVLAWKPGQP